MRVLKLDYLRKNSNSHCYHGRSVTEKKILVKGIPNHEIYK